MRIVTISDNPNAHSGLARVHRHIIDGLSEAGHEVCPCAWHVYDSDVLAKINQGEVPERKHYTTKGGADLRIIAMPKSSNSDSMNAAFGAIEYLKPDVVVTSGDYWSFFYMPPIKTQLDFSFKWVSYLTVEEDEILPKWRPFLRFADATCVPTRYGVDTLRKCGIDASYVPYGVEESFFHYGDAGRAEVRRRLGIDGFRLITVGQNTARKNLPSVLLAAKRIKEIRSQSLVESLPRLSVYIHTNTAATDPSEAYQYDLHELVETLGVGDIVELPSEHCSFFEAPPDRLLADHYNASDLFLLASTSEGYCLPMVEAMACGLPALANSATSVTEHIGWRDDQPRRMKDALTPGLRGFHVKPRVDIYPPAKFASVCDAEALAQSIYKVYMRHCLSDSAEAELKRMRSNCLEYAKGNTWEGMKRRLLECIQQISGPPAIPVEIL